MNERVLVQYFLQLGCIRSLTVRISTELEIIYEVLRKLLRLHLKYQVLVKVSVLV